MVSKKKDLYLPGIEHARRAFGHCFIRKIESRWTKTKPIYEFFFSYIPINTKPNGGGRGDTWNDWKTIPGKTNPFLGQAPGHIPKAIDWAVDNSLLTERESECFKKIHYLLTNPTGIADDQTFSEMCLSLCENIAMDLAHFIEINNAQFFYDPFNVMAVDGGFFEPTNIGDVCSDSELKKMRDFFDSTNREFTEDQMKDINLGCNAMITALVTLSLNSTFFQMNIEELSWRLADLKKGKAREDEVFYDGRTLGELKRNLYVKDLLKEHLFDEGLWLLERFVALVDSDSNDETTVVTDSKKNKSQFTLADVRSNFNKLASARLKVSKQQNGY